MSGEAFDNAVTDVIAEYRNARMRFAPMRGAHEGWAVIFEEVDELWDEVKDSKRPNDEYMAAMYAEAKQVAAMAIAFMAEVCT